MRVTLVLRYVVRVYVPKWYWLGMWLPLLNRTRQFLSRVLAFTRPSLKERRWASDLHLDKLGSAREAVRCSFEPAGSGAVTADDDSCRQEGYAGARGSSTRC